MNRPRTSDELPAPPSLDNLSWHDHRVMQHDDGGGLIGHRASFRFLPRHGDRAVYPWGLAKMDNGELAVAGVAGPMTIQGPRQTVIGLSDDEGATWHYVEVPGCASRPMMLAYLGRGVLSFMTSGSPSQWTTARS